MSLYQPQQVLSWKYFNASGKLYIVSNITTQLGTNEKVSASATPVDKGATSIALTVISGINNIPVLQEVYYTNIGANLNTVSAVKARIATLQMVNVTVIVVKDNVPKGNVTNTTSSSGNIVIL